MADPLSIAAATAGFLGLAGQLGDGLVKLQGLYSVIDSAPRVVADLIASLADLLSVLQSVQNQLKEIATPFRPAPEGMRRCFTQCSRLQQALAVKLQLLERKFQTSKRARVSMPFRKQDIDDMMQRLESCKGSLLISQQVFTAAMVMEAHNVTIQNQESLVSQQQQMGQDFFAANQQQGQHLGCLSKSTQIIQRDISGIQGDLARLNSTFSDLHRSVKDHHTTSQQASTRIQQQLEILQQQCGGIVESVERESQLTRQYIRESEKRFLDVAAQLKPNDAIPSSMVQVSVQLGSFQFAYKQIRTTQETNSTKAQKKTGAGRKWIDLRVPLWFLEDQYRIAVVRSTSGWTSHLRCYRIVAEMTPFMIACQDGDIATAQSLIQSGTAAPFDQYNDYLYGDGLRIAADYAIEAGNMNLCNFLYDQGLRHQITPQEIRPMLKHETMSGDSVFTMWRTMCNTYCEYMQIDNTDLDSIKAGATGYTKFVWMMRTPEEDWSKQDRVQAALSFGYSGAQHNSTLVSLLSPALDESQALTQVMSHESFPTLLHLAAINLGFSALKSEFWLQVFTRTIASGVDTHLLRDKCLSLWGTPMGLYFDSSNLLGFFEDGVSDWDAKRIQRALRQWASLIERQGLDLELYASEERKILLDTKEEEWPIPPNKAHDAFLTLFDDFTFGPRPGDWRFWFKPNANASEFWRMTEKSISDEDLLAQLLAIKLEVEATSNQSEMPMWLPGAWQDASPQEFHGLPAWLDQLKDADEASNYQSLTVVECDIGTVYDVLNLGSFGLLRANNLGGWEQAVFTKAQILRTTARMINSGLIAMQPRELLLRLLVVKYQVEQLIGTSNAETPVEEDDVEENEAREHVIYEESPDDMTLYELAVEMNSWSEARYLGAVHDVQNLPATTVYENYSLAKLYHTAFDESQWELVYAPRNMHFEYHFQHEWVDWTPPACLIKHFKNQLTASSPETADKGGKETET